MTCESKLAQSIQPDNRRDVTIERENGRPISLSGVCVKAVVVVAGQVVVAELFLQPTT